MEEITQKQTVYRGNKPQQQGKDVKKTEKMLGTGEVHKTQLYNGYEKQVAHLYT